MSRVGHAGRNLTDDATARSDPEISLEQYAGQCKCHDTKLNLACGPIRGRKDLLGSRPVGPAGASWPTSLIRSVIALSALTRCPRSRADAPGENHCMDTTPPADMSRPGATGRDRRPGRRRAGLATPARDGLGRPLPYGSEGIPTTDEGVHLSPTEALEEAQRLLGRGPAVSRSRGARGDLEERPGRRARDLARDGAAGRGPDGTPVEGTRIGRGHAC